MYKKILCPVDGSATSKCGMNEAIKLAKELNAEIRFLHVLDTYFPIMDMNGDLNVVYITDILRENGLKILKVAEKTALKSGITSNSKMVESFGGQVAKGVLSEVEEWSADLIVMGTHGLKGIERLVMGSDAQTIVRSSPVPVLLVRHTGKDK